MFSLNWHAMAEEPYVPLISLFSARSKAFSTFFISRTVLPSLSVFQFIDMTFLQSIIVMSEIRLMSLLCSETSRFIL